jgi:hypothetical protein
MRTATMTAAAAAVAAAAAASIVPPLSSRTRARAGFFAALLGDSLALQSHYEYSATTIADRVPGGSTTEFGAPLTNYGVGWGRANCTSSLPPPAAGST